MVDRSRRFKLFGRCSNYSPQHLEVISFSRRFNLLGAPHPRLPDLVACLPKDGAGWNAGVVVLRTNEKIGWR